MSMKRILAAVLTMLCLWGNAAAESVKYDAMPEIFAVTVVENEREIDEGSAYVYKEYVTTANPDVNAELRSIVDAYDRELSPTLQSDPRKRGERGSVLNISTVYYRTGEKYLSTLTIARVSYEEQQLSTAFTTRTWDLETGRRITLADLFTDEAWEVLAGGVREHLEAIFPNEERSSEAIRRLCTPEAIAGADFTLSGMELTLHYAAGDIVPGKVTLTHARFFYPDLRDLMTETGLAATDNSRWKMVAVTFDDGPKDYPSSYTLDALRKIGARGTYFTVGKQLERYGYVLQKQYDQNHIFGTHTFHHWGGGSFKSDASRLKEIALSAEWTLALVGEEASLFRAPGGTYPTWVKAGVPMPIIQWSVDTYDYTGKSAERIFYTFRDKVTEGDIILCHDTGKYLHESVPLWGEYLLARGFMFVTVDELACAYGLEMQPSVVYWSVRPGENSASRGQ